MKKEKLVYERKDGRWEARYKKGISPEGRALYGAVYGDTKEEVIRKRSLIVGKEDDDMPPVPTQLNLLILGAGSHGQDVKEIAEQLRVFQKIRFLDDKVENDEVIGTCREAMKFRGAYACAFVAIGDNKRRRKWMEFLKSMNYLLPRLVSPSAIVSPNAEIEDGTVVMAQANVGASHIHSGCILAPACNIESNTEILEYSRIDTAGIVPKGNKLPVGTWVHSGEVYRRKKPVSEDEQDV